MSGRRVVAANAKTILPRVEVDIIETIPVDNQIDLLARNTAHCADRARIIPISSLQLSSDQQKNLLETIPKNRKIKERERRDKIGTRQLGTPTWFQVSRTKFEKVNTSGEEHRTKKIEELERKKYERENA